MTIQLSQQERVTLNYADELGPELWLNCFTGNLVINLHDQA